ncbi:Hypothetical protein NTJ_10687 [Nesidiocoris tenuis]|uniref:Uncharacterized protein n=1 Tax=Nesidiocoris tenuis TaxID=355587 RepID=A0ABN7B0C6_9HEMI|nr:Hypothetical protein NTJ_10687 [Nesidiocoris tenuis]
MLILRIHKSSKFLDCLYVRSNSDRGFRDRGTVQRVSAVICVRRAFGSVSINLPGSLPLSRSGRLFSPVKPPFVCLYPRLSSSAEQHPFSQPTDLLHVSLVRNQYSTWGPLSVPSGPIFFP